MWLDKVSTRNILKLRDRFGIRRFVETGTAEGNNAIFYSQHFEEVHTSELDVDLVKKAIKRASGISNLGVYRVYRMPSPEFIYLLRGRYGLAAWDDMPLFFLDAHSPGNWPILGELEALKGFEDCCIVIHDFKVPDERLGYISYGGQDLDLDYVREDLFKVNPDFVLYHNTREMAEVYTREEVERGIGLPMDEATEWSLNYAWSSPLKTYRGILYAVPEELGGLEVVRWR